MPIGLSGSDFVVERGPIESDVFAAADYLEFGGFASPLDDANVASFRRSHPERPLGRHLVSLGLAERALRPALLDALERELSVTPITYLVTDFGYWQYHGQFWFRPMALSARTAARVARNARAIEERFGLPLYVENPYSLFFRGDLSLPAFLRALAENGARLCLDVGHFVAACENTGWPLSAALDELPFAALGMSHIAGLVRTSYAGRSFATDNHFVVPDRISLDVLSELAARSPQLARVTVEAELAPRAVQVSALKTTRSALRG